MISESGHRRFRLLRCVGQGSFGKVYQAEMLSGAGLVRPVALKVYVDHKSAPEEGLQRFRDEARLMARVSHRAPVSVIDLVQLPIGWTIVMEWVEGVDATELATEAPVPPRIAMAIISEVAGALAAAWEATNDDGTPIRLIHRDIKPSNLRISLHGDVRLLDFGAARGDIAGREALTSQWRLGTLPYMAPERMEEGIDGPACDIFSLGLVALDLMRGTGRPSVLPREAQLKRYVQLLEEDLIQSSGLNPLAIAEVVHLVSRMIATDFRDRPTAREVAEESVALVDRIPGPRAAAWLAAQARHLAATRPTPSLDDPWTGRVISRRTPLHEAPPGPVEPDALTELIRTPGTIAPPGSAPAEDPPHAGTIAVKVSPSERTIRPASAQPRPVDLDGPPVPEALNPSWAAPDPIVMRAPWFRWQWAAGISAVVAMFAVGGAVVKGWTDAKPVPAPAPVAEPVLPPEDPNPKVENTKVENTKVENTKVEPAKVEPVRVEPTKVEAPKPRVEPKVPPQPEPVVVPQPPKPPEPKPTPPATATVSVASGPHLTATQGGQRVSLPGRLAPGKWTLTDDKGNGFGSVTVAAGESVSLSCSAQNNRCSK